MGPGPHLPLALGPGGCLYGGDVGPADLPSLRPGIAGVSGGGRARPGELAQISGLFGERRVVELTWLWCTVAEKNPFP